MGVVDLIILIFIIFGAVLGFKRGFTKSLLSSIGLIIVIVFSFLLKNPVSVILYENLPFFKFGGILKGVTVLNIALYEMIAFVLLFAILSIILKVLSMVSSIFEKILSVTIILGIPSKIMGALIGAVGNFVFCFAVLYVLNLPIFNYDIIKESRYKDIILNNTPLLSGFAEKSVSVVNEFIAIKEKYKEESSAEEFNKEVLDLFLKYKVVDVSSIDKLVEKEKIQINDIESILMKYRNDGDN